MTLTLRQLLAFTGIATVLGYFIFMLSFSATTYAICSYTTARGWEPNSCNILYHAP